MRKLLRIGWRDMIMDTEVLRRTGLPGIDTMLTKAQLRWSGHIVRMGEERLLKPSDCCMASYKKERDLLEVNGSATKIR